MKNFLKNNGLWVLFAAAVIAVALALMSVFSNTSSPLTNLANTIASPFRSAYTAVAEWFNDKQKYYQDYTGLEEENARLRQQIASMEAEIRQARDDSAENERLKELLGLQEERPDLTEDIVLATITEHAVTNWAATLTISRGTNDGLEVGDCVIDETGRAGGHHQRGGHQLGHDSDAGGHRHLSGRSGVPHRDTWGGRRFLLDGGKPAAAGLFARRLRPAGR